MLRRTPLARHRAVFSDVEACSLTVRQAFISNLQFLKQQTWGESKQQQQKTAEALVCSRPLEWEDLSLRGTGCIPLKAAGGAA